MSGKKVQLVCVCVCVSLYMRKSEQDKKLWFSRLKADEQRVLCVFGTWPFSPCVQPISVCCCCWVKVRSDWWSVTCQSSAPALCPPPNPPLAILPPHDPLTFIMSWACTSESPHTYTPPPHTHTLLCPPFSPFHPSVSFPFPFFSSLPSTLFFSLGKVEFLEEPSKSLVISRQGMVCWIPRYSPPPLLNANGVVSALFFFFFFLWIVPLWAKNSTLPCPT